MSSQTFTTCVGGSSNEMPGVTEAPKIESSKDAGRPAYRSGMRATEDAGGRRFAGASGMTGVSVRDSKT